MPETIEIPRELPDEWPTEWSGNTVINCEQDGGFCLELQTDGHPSRVHIQNYEEILRRWKQLWPQAHAIVSDMLASYERDYIIRNPGASLDMRLPAEPITDEVEWFVGVKFSRGDGEWHVTFRGWTAIRDESQPYF